MKQILLVVAVATMTFGAFAEETHFFQASLTPEIALRPKTDRISGISLSIVGSNPQNGLELGFVNGSTDESSGFAWGLWNDTETFNGVSWAFVNTCSKKFSGWQSGLVNISKEFHGLQTGLVNYTDSLRGVQLGVVCIVNDNPWFTEFPDKLAKGFVFLNWSF